MGGQGVVVIGEVNVGLLELPGDGVPSGQDPSWKARRHDIQHNDNQNK